jgi:hypothetical protein
MGVNGAMTVARIVMNGTAWRLIENALTGAIIS